MKVKHFDWFLLFCRFISLFKKLFSWLLGIYHQNFYYVTVHTQRQSLEGSLSKSAEDQHGERLGCAGAWLLLTALRSFQQRDLECTQSLQKGKYNFSHSSLCLSFGAFIGHICIQRVLPKFFVLFFQINILELELQMTSVTEKRKKKLYEPFFYIHTASLVSGKKKIMSSQYFLRYVLRINNKKHANFMDEIPDISKS